MYNCLNCVIFKPIKVAIIIIILSDECLSSLSFLSMERRLSHETSFQWKNNPFYVDVNQCSVLGITMHVVPSKHFFKIICYYSIESHCKDWSEYKGLNNNIYEIFATKIFHVMS